MIDKKYFFDHIKGHPLQRTLNQKQVTNMSAIIDEFEKRDMYSLPKLAYMLATVLRECGSNMAPITEIGKKPYFNKYEPGTRIGKNLGNTQKGDGYKYRGRGYVQLTGRANYHKMSEMVGTDLIANPEEALDPLVASKVMFEGMARGTFTGKKMDDYFNGNRADFVNARRIINGLDHAQEIARNARLFLAALHVAQK